MNLMRSAFRLLLTTCFLLLVAWVALKLMQYNGDWNRLLQEARQAAAPFVEKAAAFFNEEILPKAEELVNKAQSFAGAK